MRLKMIMIIALIWIGQSAFGQVNKTENTAIENSNSNNQKKEYSKGTIINETSEQDFSNQNKDAIYNNKEWKKIKREIRRNKKRITNSEVGIHSYKTLDTIYLEIKISKTNSQITDW